VVFLHDSLRPYTFSLLTPTARKITNWLETLVPAASGPADAHITGAARSHWAAGPHRLPRTDRLVINTGHAS
jgi:hypothetical protein